MNQHGSDAPRDDLDEGASQEVRPRGPAEANSRESAVGDAGIEQITPDEPIVANLVEATGESIVRVGSPFAVDPVWALPQRPFEQLYDVGPIRYTAMGAVAASVMVIGFAAAGAWWFPAGGALIAALGCVLSIFGLYSTHRLASAGLLAIHLSLFVFSYGRSLG